MDLFFLTKNLKSARIHFIQVVKMVNKMIRNTIIEIAIIIALVGLSIPVWKNFNENINTTIAYLQEKNTSLELTYKSTQEYDSVVVNNSHSNEAEYQVLLVTSEDCDNNTITINGKTYKLNTFFKKQKGNLYEYAIATDKIVSTRRGYKIVLNVNNDVNYYYKLAELTEI